MSKKLTLSLVCSILLVGHHKLVPRFKSIRTYLATVPLNILQQMNKKKKKQTPQFIACKGEKASRLLQNYVQWILTLDAAWLVVIFFG